ncbi:MAG: hypothetical protein Q8Q85_06640 [Gemmatimonadales bacterium]|nr:hypothetical protein [Gemmatimonadales bacterium]
MSATLPRVHIRFELAGPFCTCAGPWTWTVNGAGENCLRFQSFTVTCKTCSAGVTIPASAVGSTITLPPRETP